MGLVSRFYASLFAVFLFVLVVKPDSVTSYGAQKAGHQPNLLQKRNNIIDATSEKNENNQNGSPKEVVEIASVDGNTAEIASSGSSSGDEDFDSSGILDVELASGSGDDSNNEIQKENAEIKLNGKRLHSISDAITKLLNSGRKRLEILKHGQYTDINKKSSGPVVHAYVSDNHYDGYEDTIPSKLYRKNVLHRRHDHPPYYYRRRRLPTNLDYSQMPYNNLFDEYPMDYNDDVAKLQAYKKPMYFYYPEMLAHRYDMIPQQYPEGLPENMNSEEMERAILSNYALQQEVAGKGRRKENFGVII